MKTCFTKLPVIYLQPGEMHFAEDPVLVTTVLGSCVSVTLWNRRLGIGAICHGLLPRCRTLESCRFSCPEMFKYVDCSIQKMIDRLTGFGINRNELETKMFGGADMFPPSLTGDRRFGVGKMNTDVAFEVIRSKGFHIASFNVGGTRGRRISFNTENGEVLVRQFEPPDTVNVEFESQANRLSDFITRKRA